jgi:methionyl-tRNA formyltransferase
MAGERETGITIMRIVKALDAGAMLATAARPIDENETSEDVERDLARTGASLLVETLDRLARAPVDEVPQNDADATYAPRLTKEDGIVSWSSSARHIHNQIRGLHPWPHAFSFLDGERIILRRSRVVSDADSDEGHVAPGTIIAAKADDMLVATGRGTLAISELQREGRRATGAREFLAGRPVREGERFREHA